MDHTAGFLNIVSDAKKRVKEEDFRDVKKRLDAAEKFDPGRHARGLRMGHAATFPARFISVKASSNATSRTRSPTNPTLVLYCGGGFRSALAADNLQKMGYRNVISMDGGWRGWTESDFPIAKD